MDKRQALGKVQVQRDAVAPAHRKSKPPEATQRGKVLDLDLAAMLHDVAMSDRYGPGRHPDVRDQVPRLAADKSAALADPDFRRLYLAWDEAYGWYPDDPRLVDLEAKAAAWLGKQPPNRPSPSHDAGTSTVNVLLSAQVGTISAAWRRLNELSSAPLKSSLL